MSYVIYTLSAPAERIEWENIRYVGMSIDIFSRFKQHLAPHDDTNPEKTAWIQDLLARGIPRQTRGDLVSWSIVRSLSISRLSRLPSEHV